MKDGTPEAEMEALYRSYVDIFNRQDSAALSGLLAYPAAGSGRDPLQTYGNALEFQQMIEETWKQFKTQGWARSQVDSTQGALMTGDTGVVFARFSRYRADGSHYESGCGHYVMRRLDGRWKIIGMFVPTSA